MSSHNDSFAASGCSPTPDSTTVDFRCENHGSIFLLYPVSQSAQSWIEEKLPEDAQRFTLLFFLSLTAPCQPLNPGGAPIPKVGLHHLYFGKRYSLYGNNGRTSFGKDFPTTQPLKAELSSAVLYFIPTMNEGLFRS